MNDRCEIRDCTLAGTVAGEWGGFNARPGHLCPRHAYTSRSFLPRPYSLEMARLVREDVSA